MDKKVIVLRPFDFSVKLVLKPECSGTVVSYDSSTESGLVHLREQPGTFVAIHLETLCAYVHLNRLRKLNPTEEVIQPKKGDWVILDQYPPRYAAAPKSRSACRWAIVPQL